MPLPLPGGKTLTIDFDRLDADRDGKGSKAELKAYCLRHGFTPVVVVCRGRRYEDNRLEALFLKCLDADGDGKLTAAELRAPAALRRYDLDEDETLTLAELWSAAPEGGKPADPPEGRRRDRPGRDVAHSTWREVGREPARRGRAADPPARGRHRIGGPGGWWLTFRLVKSAPDVRSAADFLASQFETALGDRAALTKADLAEDATTVRLPRPVRVCRP